MESGMRPAGDWHHDPEAKEWIADVLENMVPKLEESVMTMSLVPAKVGETSEGDVKYWVELGASIMYDKPLILVCERDQELPPKLKRVADEIVRLDFKLDDPRGAKQLGDAIERIKERFVDA
jgi:hypothetical protein